MNTLSRRLLAAVVFLLAGSLGGCGPRTLPKAHTYKVQGRILLNGEPARYVSVRFLPVEGGPEAVGKTDGDGHFELRTYSKEDSDGAVAGQHKVTIEELNPVKFGGPPKGEKVTIVPGGSLDAPDTVEVAADDSNDLTVEFQSP
jgi:hypothetical protein